MAAAQPVIKISEVTLAPRTITSRLRWLGRRDPEPQSALHSISLEVMSHQILGVLGPRNSGKSSLLEIIAGLRSPSHGSVQVIDQTPSKDPVYQAQVQLVSKKHPLAWPELTVREILPIIREKYQIEQQELNDFATSLAEAIGIADLLKVETRKLGKLNCLRCEIFIALLTRPKILLLDEVLDDLTPAEVSKVHELLEVIYQHWDITIIIASEQPARLENLCQQVIILNKGVMVYNGSCQELFAHYIDTAYIDLTLSEPVTSEQLVGETLVHDGLKVRLRVRRAEQSATIDRLATELPIKEITLTELTIAEIIDLINISK